MRYGGHGRCLHDAAQHLTPDRYHAGRAVADVLGIFGPALLAILCLVAAVRVRRRVDDAITPAALDEAAAPEEAAPEDWQCGDLARALRHARKLRHK